MLLCANLAHDGVRTGSLCSGSRMHCQKGYNNMSEGPMLLLQRLVVARKTQSLAVEEAILNGCIQLRFAELFLVLLCNSRSHYGICIIIVINGYKWL